MTASDRPDQETYSPWTVVHVVFRHLVEEGLHPTMGAHGDPGEPAAQLLRALGVASAPGGHSHLAQRTRANLAELRARLLDDP